MNMKPMRYVGRDEPLQTEQGLTLNPSIIKIARRDFKARQIMPIKYVDPNTKTFAYDTLTEMSGARIDPNYPGPETLDITSLARTSVNMNTIHKEFEIPKEDLDAANMTGQPLPTTYSDAAAYQVGLLEDTMLLKGTTTEGTVINGLYNGAGNSNATNYDWATPADIITSINASITLLETDHIYGPYNLTVASEQFGYLQVLVNDGPATYYDWVQKRIGGRILQSEVFTAGTGMLTKANPVSLFEYVVARDINAETELQGIRKGNSMFGRVFVKGAPVIYNSNAICSMTDLT
jgi:uncharacterized linocin/CFP29 family protein